MCRSGRNLQQPVREIVQEPLAQKEREVLPRPVAEVVKWAVSQSALQAPNHGQRELQRWT